MRALRVDVDVVKKVAAHERAVALGMLGCERVVFVEIKRGDVGEAQTFLEVEADEFGVDAHGRGAGGEAKDDGCLLGLALADEGGDFRGDGARGIQAARVDGNGSLFVAAAGDEVRREHEK